MIYNSFPRLLLQVIRPEAAEERMDSVRRGYGYEGEVMYFMDSRFVLSVSSTKQKMYIYIFFLSLSLGTT